MTQPIDRFIADTGVTIAAHNVSARQDASPDFKDAIHFRVSVARGDRAVWSGDYSVGRGFVHTWVRENQNRPQPAFDRIKADDLPSVGARSMTLHQEETLNRAIEKFKRAAPVKAGDVLISLATDASGSDVPFAEWAADLGMSDDSIRAKRMWEACNETRRALQAAFAPDELETLYAISRDEDPYAEAENGVGGPA